MFIHLSYVTVTKFVFVFWFNIGKTVKQSDCFKVCAKILVSDKNSCLLTSSNKQTWG